MESNELCHHISLSIGPFQGFPSPLSSKIKPLHQFLENNFHSSRFECQGLLELEESIDHKCFPELVALCGSPPSETGVSYSCRGETPLFRVHFARRNPSQLHSIDKGDQHPCRAAVELLVDSFGWNDRTQHLKCLADSTSIVVLSDGNTVAWLLQLSVSLLTMKGSASTDW